MHLSSRTGREKRVRACMHESARVQVCVCVCVCVCVLAAGAAGVCVHESARVCVCVTLRALLRQLWRSRA